MKTILIIMMVVLTISCNKKEERVIEDSMWDLTHDIDPEGGESGDYASFRGGIQEDLIFSEGKFTYLYFSSGMPKFKDLENYEIIEGELILENKEGDWYFYKEIEIVSKTKLKLGDFYYTKL